MPERSKEEVAAFFSPENLKRRKRRLIIGIIVIAVVLVLTILAIVINEKRSACGHKTIEGDCQGEPIRFCGNSIPVYLDDDAKNLKGDVEKILAVYRPYVGNVTYAGTLPDGQKDLPGSIRVSRSNPVDEWGDDLGTEETKWDNDGCVITSHIYLDRDVEGDDLYNITCHELGHSFGLIHNSTSTSIMNAEYKGQSCKLLKKEQRALHRLYD